MSSPDASALRGRRTALDVRWTLSPDGSALVTWCPLGARAFDFSVRPVGGRWLATVERGMRSSTCVATRDDWDPDRCDDCALYGECQCSRHAEAYLAMCAADDEHQRVAEALRTMLSAPSAHDSAAWWALRVKAREVLAEMGETTEGAS